MKKILLTLSILFLTVFLYSQKVGINTNNPDTSSVLDIRSVDAGLLIPRMTSLQRTNIFNPAKGLLVFDNNTSSFWFYDGIIWSELLSEGNSLNQAYNKGGPGLGRKINASDSAVIIEGRDGLYVTGKQYLGTDVEISGPGIRMFYNPKKSAFRSGYVTGNHWDNDSIGVGSNAFGYNTKAIDRYSVAMGNSSIARGYSSMAFGSETEANGDYSTASGRNTKANGNYTTTLGSNNLAQGDYSTALGRNTLANANYSFAFGIGTEANGIYSISFGTNTEANGSYSTSFGFQSKANGNYSTSMGNSEANGNYSLSAGLGSNAFSDYSSALGFYTETRGRFSSSIGSYNQANGASSTVVGIYNDTLIAPETSVSNVTPLFIVGNGSYSNRSNALTVFKNGEIKINDDYILPTSDGGANQLLTTNGSGILSWVTPTDINTQNTLDEAYREGGPGNGRIIIADDSAVIIEGTDGFYVNGDFGLGTDVELSGAGSKMFFNPKNAAFRAGVVTGNHWDNDSVGRFSLAIGLNAMAMDDHTVAIGHNSKSLLGGSMAIGTNAESKGSNSIAMGHNSKTNGSFSLAAGYSTLAEGSYSVALGNNSSALSNLSFAAGSFTTALGYSSTALGSSTKASGTYSSTLGFLTQSNGYSSTVLGMFNDTLISSQTNVNNNTPLFIVGNGNHLSDRSNALTVFKDGRVKINDEYTLPSNDGLNNQVITTDGSGVLTWTNASDSITSLDESYDKGGLGKGRKIYANDSAVVIEGTDGLYVSGTFNLGTNVEIEGAGTRMFFNPKNSAFRSGTVTGNHWDNDSIGSYSIALGYNAKATGFASSAFGLNNVSRGYSSLSMGFNSKSIGNYSTSIGVSNNSIGLRSMSFGNTNISSGQDAISLGKENLASGNKSIAIGENSTASGLNSIAIGYGTLASGSRTLALGEYNIASSSYLLALGNGSSDLNRENSLHIFSSTNNAYFSGSIRPMVDNTVALGSLNLRWTTVYATNGTINTSDSTLKENIVPLSYGLNELMKLKPVNFSWKGDKYQNKKIGFIAQDLLKVVPEVVVTKEEVINEETGEVKYQDAEKLGVYYSDLIPLLTKSIQEQQVQIQTQNDQLESQKLLLEKQQLQIEMLLEKYNLNK